MMRRALCLTLALAAAPLWAQEPDLRPQTRPTPSTEAEATAMSPPDTPDIRPASRPAVEDAEVILASAIVAQRPEQRPYERPELAYGAQTLPIFRAEKNMFAFNPNLMRASLRPTVRPAAIVEAANAARIARQRGQVCGDPALQGDALGAVPGPGRCVVDEAVRLRSVAGVALQPAATIDCKTASALKNWVEGGAKPAVGQMGGGVSSLRVVSHYSCRNRNSASTGRLSEHSFGHAIDIAGVKLSSGEELTVLTDWGRGAAGQALAAMWRSACGPFGTVLGPNANAAHRDHFHFDTARYRSGSYCR